MSAAASRPRFTIVTPNWNGRAYLRPCLDSVLEQNYPELEYIVVDGASTDGSRLLIDEYRPRLSTVICEPDNGHADALNKGFDASTGELMGWINSDDVILPGTLSFVARLFQARPDIEWITGRPSSMNADGVIEWMGATRPWSRLRFLAGDNQWIQQESTFWRRSLWERAGARLDTDFRLANDFELWCRFFRHAELHTVDRHLGCFRVRPGQRSIVFKTRYETEAKAILGRELEAAEPEFRSAFGALLPDSPVTLDDDTRRARHAELAPCDPPIIRASSLNPRGRASRNATVDTRVFNNALERARAPSLLERFAGVHTGQRCFIMGNGATLTRIDLDLLDGETVFACDDVYQFFDRVSWLPAYYACTDAQVLSDQAGDIRAMLTGHPAIAAFFPSEILEPAGERRRFPTRVMIPTGRNRFYFREAQGARHGGPEAIFSADIDQHVVCSPAPAIAMLQIAAYMGFSELYLIGFDELAVGTADQASQSALTSQIIEHYRFAREALEARGIKVFNATPGSAPGIFDAVDFATLIDPDTAAIIKTRAATAPAAAASASAPAGVESLISRAPTQLRAPLLSIWRNRRFTGAVAVAAALGAALLASPAAEPMRPWLWPLALFMAAAAFTGAVAIKSRRLLFEAHRQLSELHGREAARELRYIELEAQIEDLRTRLEDIEPDDAGT